MRGPCESAPCARELSALSHKLGWLESEMDIKLVRCASSPLSVTASRPISSAIWSGCTPEHGGHPDSGAEMLGVGGAEPAQSVLRLSLPFN